MAYLCGSVPFGPLICHAKGIDLRSVGSGNVGATNVGRALGMAWAVLVLLLDAAKGFLPVWLAAALVPVPRRPLWVAATMVMAVLGHVFSVFLRFRGGKGVAAGLGVTLAVSPIAGICGLAVYAVVYAVTRISSVGSLSGVVVTLVVMWLLQAPAALLVAMIVICLVIFVRHGANMRRLFDGEER